MTAQSSNGSSRFRRWCARSLSVLPVYSIICISTFGPFLLGNASAATDDPHPIDATCPSDIEQLGAEFLDELPGYYNRAQVRGRLPDSPLSRSRMLLADGLDRLDADDLSEFNDPAIEGFFFSTLERTVRNSELVLQQGFHQIFLTRDAAGWLFLTVRSSWGDYPTAERVTPPLDSSSGTLAQATRTWLRDCQAR